MPANVKRKNGKTASCEPCRIGKVRCDHKQPVCERCIRRNTPGECFYHPAPLTRTKRLSTIVATNRAASVTDSTGLTDTFDGNFETNDPRRDTIASLNTINIAISSTTSPGSVIPPVALASLPWLSLSSLDPTASDRPIPTVTYDDRGNATFAEDVASTMRLLSQLKHLPMIKKLVHEYYRLGQHELVPGPLILPAILDLEQIYNHALHPQATHSTADPRETLREVAQRVLRSTAMKIDVTPTLSVLEFRSSYTGPNLRVETIGLICTIAARACFLGLTRDDQDWSEFVQIMFQCSARCIGLAREVGVEVSDIMTWLSYENLRLSTSIQGLGSPNVWRRLGELATDIFAIDIHRESVITKAPLFLAECRRRTFAAAFLFDKNFATLFARPPRISGRFTDCQLPLDIADENFDILVETSDEDQLQLQQTREAWSVDGKHSSATWIRVRYILARFREDLLAYPFQTSSQESMNKLRQVSRRCSQTWLALPDHLHYTSACWHQPSLSPLDCLMLAEAYLLYLETQFHIYRLLDESQFRHSSDLLRIANDTIQTIKEIGNHRSWAVYVRRRFPAIVLSYGLAGAIVLTRALKMSHDRTDAVSSAGLSRPVLIRQLSVYASTLESVFDQDDTNYALCVQAAKVIAKTLDEVIEYRPDRPSDVTANTTDLQSDERGDGSSHARRNGEAVDYEAIDLMDIDNWIQGFDWTLVGDNAIML